MLPELIFLGLIPLILFRKIKKLYFTIKLSQKTKNKICQKFSKSP